MKIGDVILTNKIEHRGFNRKDLKATFQAKPGALMVYMYMGAITPDSAPHYNPDGVMAAMGYGPIMTTVAQRGLIDALRQARQFTDDTSLGRGDTRLQIDAALLAAENFLGASAPTIDPILKDAARFAALLDVLEKKIGADLVLQQLLGAPAPGQGPIPGARAALLSIIDSETAK